MGIRNFIQRKVIEKKLANLPPAQRDMFAKMMEKDPDLFTKIGKEVEERKKKGQDEIMASVAVMKKYEADLQKLAKQL